MLRPFSRIKILSTFFTFPAIILVAAAATAASDDGQTCIKDWIDYTGAIHYNKTELSLGDIVYVFNADAPPERDDNDYILPEEFKKTGLGVYLGENEYFALWGDCIPGDFGSQLDLAIGIQKRINSIKGDRRRLERYIQSIRDSYCAIRVWEAIPEQCVVFFHL